MVGRIKNRKTEIDRWWVDGYTNYMKKNDGWMDRKKCIKNIWMYSTYIIIYYI